MNQVDLERRVKSTLMRAATAYRAQQRLNRIARRRERRRTWVPNLIIFVTAVGVVCGFAQAIDGPWYLTAPMGLVAGWVSSVLRVTREELAPQKG